MRYTNSPSITCRDMTAIIAAHTLLDVISRPYPRKIKKKRMTGVNSFKYWNNCKYHLSSI